MEFTQNCTFFKFPASAAEKADNVILLFFVVFVLLPSLSRSKTALLSNNTRKFVNTYKQYQSKSDGKLSLVDHARKEVQVKDGDDRGSIFKAVLITDAVT